MATRKPIAPKAPRFVRHLKRPEWGVGRVTDVFAGLVRVMFADGSPRDFRLDVLEVVEEADVPADVLAAAAAPPPTAAPARAKKPAVKKAVAKKETSK